MDASKRVLPTVPCLLLLINFYVSVAGLVKSHDQVHVARVQSVPKVPQKSHTFFASAVDVKAYVDHDCPAQIIPNSPLTCSSTKKERRYPVISKGIRVNI